MKKYKNLIFYTSVLTITALLLYTVISLGKGNLEAGKNITELTNNTSAWNDFIRSVAEEATSSAALLILQIIVILFFVRFFGWICQRIGQPTVIGEIIAGACAGSTSGGMKVTRFIILMKTATHSIKKAVSPRSVFSVKVDGKTVEKNIVNGVLGYFVVYMLFAAVSILLISFDNKDFTTTVTAVIATMNNIGPGLGLVGPTGSFADFSALSKIVMSIGMLVGRLEFYPILILFSPYAWKRT